MWLRRVRVEDLRVTIDGVAGAATPEKAFHRVVIKVVVEFKAAYLGSRSPPLVGAVSEAFRENCSQAYSGVRWAGCWSWGVT